MTFCAKNAVAGVSERFDAVVSAPGVRNLLAGDEAGIKRARQALEDDMAERWRDK